MYIYPGIYQVHSLTCVRLFTVCVEGICKEMWSMGKTTSYTRDQLQNPIDRVESYTIESSYKRARGKWQIINGRTFLPAR